MRFVCLERRLNNEVSSESSSNPSNQSIVSLSDSVSPSGSCTTARKRIIYAHSDILTRRSEYFATMLASSFAENSAISTGERKLYTVVVEDADFETMYWLLKYCYANWLLFKHNDDPRTAVEGVGAGCSAKWLNGQQGEWDWKTFHKGGNEEDARSATSADSLPVSSAVSGSTSNSDVYHQNAARVSPNVTSTGTRTSPSKSTINSNSTPRQTNPTSSRRAAPSAASNSVTMSISGSSSSPRAKHVSIATQSNNLPATTHYPVSPRSSRHPGNTSSPDPHPHPTPTPGPASALSMYQVAHRYAMPNLASLSLEHIMSTITAQSSFALLLATSVWEELHTLIEVSGCAG